MGRKGASQSLILFFLFAFLACVKGHPNYKDALAKSILFFQGQRSGKLPVNQEIAWRSDSGLTDGSEASVDLQGGYYDGGDNVKFNFPMAFTTTMLSWSAIEYAKRLGPQLEPTRVAIRWATDYLLKCSNASPGKLYVGVGEPNADHKCWQRPEDMTTPRSVFSVSSDKPGSDVAAETAAALAAASMVFRKVDPAYSKLLLETSKKVWKFAIDYRGSYSDSLGPAVCPFYCSYSGYKDELLWGAAWLFTATKDTSYIDFLKSLGADDKSDIFSWDNKYAGARVLLSKQALINKAIPFEQFNKQAEEFMCSILPNLPSTTTEYTPGGLMYKLDNVNLQYVTSITFLLTTYAKYMASSRHTFTCGSTLVTPSAIRNLAKKQVDYILGENPLKMSYMVGYGERFPNKVHHRGSSMPSTKSHSTTMGCEDGFEPYFKSSSPNPNVLVGAIVGGPNKGDAFSDDRNDYSQSESATYINAAIVGPLAYLAGSNKY
ncbi:hypothetical protein GIB67_037102 [Kingdonia uniflora]|uniref:Endoglucanase n=1 Tax=Kingdonia uniflora TaxID=39325 RepID=A0A7J7LI50_9MAGN|nr:hypothetical protein GIB67_037102 [Kingdonia uniflora]